MEAVLDGLSNRQIHIELLDQRCVSEARRLHACGSKGLFRAKMLEHRRLQAQLVQLQRYRENVHAQLDAMSNHEINQSFIRAMQRAGRPMLNHEDAADAMDEMQKTMSQAREMTELLGQPLDTEVPDDEDLEREFLDTIATNVPTELAKPMPVCKQTDLAPQVQREERIAVSQRLVVPPTMLVANLA